MRFFDKKTKKFGTLEELEIMMKKKCFSLRKKRSDLLKLHLYEIGEAQNMLVVAGRLVTISMKSIVNAGELLVSATAEIVHLMKFLQTALTELTLHNTLQPCRRRSLPVN